MARKIGNQNLLDDLRSIYHGPKGIQGPKGINVTKGWYVTKEQEKDLEEKLNAVLNEWLTKYNHQPTFYYLDNIEKVRLEEEAE